MKTKLSIQDFTIESFLAVWILLWLNGGIYGFVQRYIPGIFMYAIALVWLILVSNRKKNIKNLVSFAFKFIPAFSLLAVFYLINSSSLVKTYLYFMIYCAILVCILFFYYDEPKKKKILLGTWFFDTVIICVNTLIQIAKNPLIIRQMSANASYLQEQGMTVKGVANFSHVLTYSLVCLYLLYLLFKKGRTKSKISVVLFVILLELVILQSQIALIMMFNIWGAILVIVFSKVKRRSHLVMFFLIIAFIFAFLATNAVAILEYLGDLDFMPRLLKIKIDDVIVLIKGGTQSQLQDVDVRLEQYKLGINAFVSNPLFGTMGDSSSIGGHATWIDFLGLFGLFSLVFFIWFLDLFKVVIRFSLKSDSGIIKVICCLFVMLGILDPILTQVVSVFFIIVLPIYSQESCCEVTQSESV